jgi:hypothetical protein
VTLRNDTGVVFWLAAREGINMADNTAPATLIDDAVKAHGGCDRWLAVTSMSAPVSMGGSLWSDKGHNGAFADAAVFIDPHRQHVELMGFGHRRLRTWFEPGLVSVRTEDGTEIDRRRDPRVSFPRGAAAAWDNIQVVYFASYAIWNYLTLPYLLTAPEVKTAEIEPWPAADSSWRRASADFDRATVETHNRLQYYNFDSDNLLVRHDYDADLLGGAPASNEAVDYREFSGLLFPTRRRVTARGADGAAGIGPILVSIDFGDITVR